MQIKHFLVILSLPQRNTKFSTPVRLLDHIRECFGEGGMSVVLLKECEASWKGISRVCRGERSCLREGAGSPAGRPWVLSGGAVLHTGVHICKPGLCPCSPRCPRLPCRAAAPVSWAAPDPTLTRGFVLRLMVGCYQDGIQFPTE